MIVVCKIKKKKIILNLNLWLEYKMAFLNVLLYIKLFLKYDMYTHTETCNFLPSSNV